MSSKYTDILREIFKGNFTVVKFFKMGQFTYSARAKAEEVLRQALDSIAAEDTNLKYQVQKKNKESETKKEVYKKMMIVDKAKLKLIIISKITPSLDGKDGFNLGGPNNGEIAVMKNYANNKEGEQDWSVLPR
ncbi:hypothetical protein G9A89_015801 [Geosiphon pyriformis]|nr:hypothetical protein G9A89_015801 [Geosiphon pyriformis]